MLGPGFFCTNFTAFWYLLYHHHRPWSQTWKCCGFSMFFRNLLGDDFRFQLPAGSTHCMGNVQPCFGMLSQKWSTSTPLTFIPSSPLQVDASLPPKGASLGFKPGSFFKQINVWAFPKNPLNTTNLHILESQGAMQTPGGGLPASCGTRKWRKICYLTSWIIAFISLSLSYTHFRYVGVPIVLKHTIPLCFFKEMSRGWNPSVF